MLHRSYPAGRRAARRPKRHFLLTAALVAISMSPLAYFADIGGISGTPSAVQGEIARQASAGASLRTASAYDLSLVDPNPTLRPEALAFARNTPLTAALKPRAAARTAPAEPSAAAVAQTPVEPSPPVAVAEAAQPVPLPVPRPAEFRNLRTSPAPQVARASSVPATPRAAAIASPQADNRTFIEKLFGVRPATPPEAALSYAALENGTGSISPNIRVSPVPTEAGAGTAVYDIVAQTVTLPNGERLEAHSGLGDMMDNPRYVNVRMKGATPPGTYVITEREALFHGVRALRLTPVGGSAAIYGRDGILAHTYLLGPRGDSNGCVSFRNYDRFLQAYLRGEIKRLIVTAGRGQDLVPPLASNRSPSRRSANAG
ncbi:hypothetical protein GGR34_003646 [Microvirga flocculans]|uniref:Tlde1 domain-containing protein n=1 Tax=Microvirga flocculans TaxID=217168 RepID=A0A7W6II85_9HYPH|nr:tlde1 domain-containing protein [Microvirga flocculans]MBB4041962.1 hypothetical protein [Microvirga flocculans]